MRKRQLRPHELRFAERDILHRKRLHNGRGSSGALWKNGHNARGYARLLRRAFSGAGGNIFSPPHFAEASTGRGRLSREVDGATASYDGGKPRTAQARVLLGGLNHFRFADAITACRVVPSGIGQARQVVSSLAN